MRETVFPLRPPGQAQQDPQQGLHLSPPHQPQAPGRLCRSAHTQGSLNSCDAAAPKNGQFDDRSQPAACALCSCSKTAAIRMDQQHQNNCQWTLAPWPPGNSCPADSYRAGELYLKVPVRNLQKAATLGSLRVPSHEGKVSMNSKAKRRKAK